MGRERKWNQGNRRKETVAAIVIITAVIAAFILQMIRGSIVERGVEGRTWMGWEGILKRGVTGTWPMEKEALICCGESGMHIGHNYQKEFWPDEPSCRGGGDYNLVCVRCGYLGGAGVEEALSHRPVIREEIHGDCVNLTVEVSDCEICGMELERRSYLGDEHNYQEVIYEEFDVAALRWEERSCEKCSRCGVIREM